MLETNKTLKTAFGDMPFGENRLSGVFLELKVEKTQLKTVSFQVVPSQAADMKM
jgi:hypothetical protein